MHPTADRGASALSFQLRGRIANANNPEHAECNRVCRIDCLPVIPPNRGELMRRHSLKGYLLSLGVVIATSAAALAGPLPADSPAKHMPESLARRALAALNDEASEAVAELRAMGPDGLRIFLDSNRAEIDAAINASGNSLKDNQVLSALDSLCQQKDCYASKLYWYKNLEQAKSAAQAQGKLILALRLLGRLDEDLSCANSRLF